MFKTITRRDIKFFVFGALLILLFDLLLNWQSAKQGFFDGFNSNK